MEFLYPVSRQFPFDEVSEKIVRELEKRNFQVPGMTIEIDDYGSGDQKLRMVRQIKGDSFILYFCRKQRTMPGNQWNDTAAITRIVIPYHEINVYEDESGPTYYRYVGNSWARHREHFMSGSKVNSKLNGKTRTYLQYKGSSDVDGKYSYSNRRSQFLVHNDDLGREYNPKRYEPTVLNTAKVMKKFQRHLERVVLKKITDQPIPDLQLDPLAQPEPIDLPQMDALGELFCMADHHDARRITQGQENPAKLQAHDRYGLVGSGYRLLTLDIRNDGTVPKIAYEGFLWCGLSHKLPETPLRELMIPGHHRSYDEHFVIKIKLNRANDIYVADHSEYEWRRSEIINSGPDEKDRFTTDELADFQCARARTIVPLSEYKGEYELPVILINRELSFDEVEILGEIKAEAA